MSERLHDGRGIVGAGGNVPFAGHVGHAVRVELPIVFDWIVAGLVIGLHDDAFNIHDCSSTHWAR